ncbi:MAG: NUDIX hydrolase [Erysipelotrichaceae bacterium]|nr:NUDIX hydrolase [Erysipelotrichaceae bacterium]
MEKQVSRKNIFDGKVIKVYLDEVVLDDEKKTKREIVHHNGGACIALRDGDYYFMVRQYRYALGKDMLELPAGKIEIGEDPGYTIAREAYEETGFTAKNIKSLGYIIPTCGYDDEKIYLYYGEVDKEVGQHLDEHERIDVYKYSYEEIKKMIMSGEIDDAKTIVTMYKIELEGLHA